MALSDEQLLDTARTKFKEKFDSYDTWADFKAFLSGLTKTKIKTSLKNAFQAEADKIRAQNASMEDKAVDLEDGKAEIDTI